MDNLLDYEADPFIGDQEGLNAIDHVANAEMRQMLINYVDQTRAKHESNTRSSDNHSFDDDKKAESSEEHPNSGKTEEEKSIQESETVCKTEVNIDIKHFKHYILN